MMNQKEQTENEKLSRNCGYMEVEIIRSNRRSWFTQQTPVVILRLKYQDLIGGVGSPNTYRKDPLRLP